MYVVAVRRSRWACSYHSSGHSGGHYGIGGGGTGFKSPGNLWDSDLLDRLEVGEFG